jgi:YesN/AraC family two-component response regulator
MEDKKNYKLKVLSDAENFNDEQPHSDSINAHTRLSGEMQVYYSIYYGDVNRMDATLSNISSRSFPVGKLSENPLVQAKYLAISFISIACRVAIIGGMFETDAYNFSDKFIQRVDRMSNEQEIFDYIFKTAHDLTKEVHEVHYSCHYSPAIKECTNYIYNHIYSKLSLSNLSEVCGLTPSYLSSLFRKETGITLSEYIMKEKMKEAANLLLEQEYTCVEIATRLGFCSQSYFCKCFKEQYNITPLKFVENPIKQIYNISKKKFV